MKVKFVNNVTKTCNAPTEQKVFKNVGGETTGTGWVLMFRLLGEITSSELDELVTVENVSSLEFFVDSEEGEDITLFTLAGYDKITASTIRHAEDESATYAEIQLSKGV